MNAQTGEPVKKAQITAMREGGDNTSNQGPAFAVSDASGRFNVIHSSGLFPLVTTKLVNFQILIFIEDTARMNFRVPFAQAHGCHF